MRLLALAVAAIALALPLAIDQPFYTNIASQILIAAIFAASLNIIVGYGGLISLGHAAFLGIAAYTAAWMTVSFGYGHLLAAAAALGAATIAAALFGLLALRATGLGFLMITLALGQSLWGVAYRWVEVTNGDNGITGIVRPMPFGLELYEPKAFYAFALAVFLPAMATIAAFVKAPLGAALVGTRDQPRRMSALGHHVWGIRWIAFVFAGFWAGVAGLLFLYYNQYINPHALGLLASAEGMLMVIAGGPATLLGPVVGAALVVILKNVVSAWVTRWMFLLGAVFVLLVVFVPEGIVPGVVRLFRARAGRRTARVTHASRARA
jgi:branched-chain amino acid transport system permease protein